MNAVRTSVRARNGQKLIRYASVSETIEAAVAKYETYLQHFESSCHPHHEGPTD